MKRNFSFPIKWNLWHGKSKKYCYCVFFWVGIFLFEWNVEFSIVIKKQNKLGILSILSSHSITRDSIFLSLLLYILFSSILSFLLLSLEILREPISNHWELNIYYVYNLFIFYFTQCHFQFHITCLAWNLLFLFF